MNDKAFGVLYALLILGVIFTVVIGLGYMFILMDETAPSTDSYGNAPSNLTNSTHGLVTNITTQVSAGNQAFIWVGVLILVVGVIGMALWAGLGKGGFGGGGRGRGW